MNIQNVSTQHPKEVNGVYAFDLKLNVDFNSGHLSVNVPPQAPFSKKLSAPLSNCPPSYPIQNQYIPQYIPIQRHQSHINLNHNSFKGQLSQTKHVQTASDQSFKTQQKYAQSLNTTTFRLDQPTAGVQCVICQKVINQDAFSLHLEEHRNRRKNKQRSSLHQSDFSIRNKDEHAQIKQMIHQPQSFSFIPHSLSFSQSSDHPNQIVSNQSNTIFIPIVAQNAPNINHNSKIYYSRSETLNNNINKSSQSSFVNNTTFLHQQVLSPTSNSNSCSQRSYISNQISNPSNQFINPYHQTIFYNNRAQMVGGDRDLNGFHMNRIESMIIRQQNIKENALQQCGQSIISQRNSIPTKYSQIYAIQRQLQFSKSNNKEESSSSSDDQSLKVYGHKSVRSLQQYPQKERSNMSQKLSKTKLPLNYLARQDFITSSTHSTIPYKPKGIN